MSLSPPTSSQPPATRFVLDAVVVTILISISTALTLGTLEFSSGGENLLVSTVLETRDNPSWLVPTLNGEPRFRKPPLPTWVSTALLGTQTVAELDQPDPANRDAAYRRLAWAIRWPTLILSAGILWLTFAMARTLFDAPTAYAAVGVCATSLLMLRFGRAMTTDLHLTLWVAVANLGLVKVLAPRPASNDPRWWLPVAAIGMGLGFMSKGPVILLQSLLPAITFWIFLARRQPRDSRQPRPRFLVPAIVSTVLFAAIAFPWFAHVLRGIPGSWSTLIAEVTRTGATNLEADPWYAYGAMLPYLAPWAIFFIAGLLASFLEKSPDPNRWLPVLMLLAPLLVMSLFKDKSERYLLPMLPAAAMVAALAIAPHVRASLSPTDRVIGWAHWAFLLVLAIGVPVAGCIESVCRTVDGEPWWELGPALKLAILLGFITVVLSAVWIFRPRVIVLGTCVVMILLQVLVIAGYRNSAEGRSEMKPVADAIWRLSPSANVVYFDPRPIPKALPQDLQIYLHRTVRVVLRESDLPLPTRSAVVVMLRREREEPPTLNGWREIARIPSGKRSWHVLGGG